MVISIYLFPKSKLPPNLRVHDGCSWDKPNISIQKNVGTNRIQEGTSFVTEPAENRNRPKIKTAFPLATNNGSLLAIRNYGREADAFSNNLAENNRKAAASLKATNNVSLLEIGNYGRDAFLNWAKVSINGSRWDKWDLLQSTAAKRPPFWIGGINKKLRPRSAKKKSLYWTIVNNYGREATAFIN